MMEHVTTFVKGVESLRPVMLIKPIRTITLEEATYQVELWIYLKQVCTKVIQLCMSYKCDCMEKLGI